MPPKSHPRAIVEATITDLSHDGKGVTRIEGKAVFVAGALLDERVRIQISRQHRHFDEANVIELLEASPLRVEPRCRHFGTCGGCSLQHLEASAQIAAKQRVLADNLQRIGKLQPQQWLPPLTAQIWGYRRRGRLSVRQVIKKGRVLVGFREASKPGFVAEIEQCEVMHPALGPKVGLLAQLIDGLDAAGDIAQIEFAAGDAQMALVFRHLNPLSEHDTAALTAFGQQHDLAIYLQPGGISSLRPLWPEQPELSFRIAGNESANDVSLAFEPLDFIQVNASINQAMVESALELLDPQPGDRVLDLFCGLGNFTLPIARRVAEVAGVEGEHALVDRAAANTVRNGIDNARFHVANLFEDQRDTAWARQDWNKIVLDPPRAGADKLLDYLPRKGTVRVVYVSCHPASLARDAGILASKGFVLTKAGVMDMFPHTAHVESIAVFDRKGAGKGARRGD